MAPKKSVDEIWKELNARPAARSNISGIPNLPGINSRARSAVPKPSLEAAAAAELVISLQEESRKRSVQYDPEKAGVSADDLQAYVAGIQRTINCLSDPERSTRRQALTSLQTKLFKGDSSTPKASPQLLQALMCGPLLYPVAALMSDPLEGCRTRALELMTEGCRQIADLEPMLPVVLPELVKRMGNVPVQVSSSGAERLVRVSTRLLVLFTPDYR